MSAPSDTFSTKLVKLVHLANGTTSSARVHHPGNVALITSLISAAGSQCVGMSAISAGGAKTVSGPPAEAQSASAGMTWNMSALPLR